MASRQPVPRTAVRLATEAAF